MKMTIEIDCTPVEARTFLGLPDVTALNEHLMSEMSKRMDENLHKLQPDELLKTWMSMGVQAQDTFRQLMTAATGGAMPK